jgi:hypothetical protein
MRKIVPSGLMKTGAGGLRKIVTGDQRVGRGLGQAGRRKTVTDGLRKIGAGGLRKIVPSGLRKKEVVTGSQAQLVKSCSRK